MIDLTTPRGLPVSVPESLQEDPSERFLPTQASEIREYYEKMGYVIVRGLFGRSDCERIRSLWNEEVKPDDGFIYRQATARLERHTRNENGWVMNPVLNLQSMDPKRFPRFRQFATDGILTSPALSGVFKTLLGETPKLVQSMYFEGNSATWEHQDSYYLDSEKIGAMAAAWIAIEDIHARAGRFFICPGSHKVKLDDHTLQNNIAENHEAYIQSVVSKIRELKLEIRAPVLEAGDVLFWNAWTIHGSLDSQDTQYSRSSVTAHAIPASHRFLQLQARVLDLDTTDINGVQVFRPKDLAKVRNRMIFSVESNFPSMFYAVKKLAIKAAVKRKSMEAA